MIAHLLLKVDNELYGIKKDIGNIKNGLNSMYTWVILLLCIAVAI